MENNFTIHDYIKQHSLVDFGLNADWSVSIYRLNEKYVLIDEEDNGFAIYKQLDNWRDEESNIEQEFISIFEHEDYKGLTTLLKELL